MGRRYHIQAIWDDEAQVYISETDVPGLIVEAETLDLFVEILQDLAPDILEANTGERAAEITFSVKRDLPLAVA